MNELLAQFSCPGRVGGLRCWTREIVLSPRLVAILKALDRPDGSEVEVLRAVHRHTVLRVRGLAQNWPSLIVKGFPLGRLKSRLQYRKYGLAELGNWHAAHQRGVPVPQYLGYFERRQLGLVKSNGVFIEDMVGYRSLDALGQGAGPGRLAVLLRAVPLISLLFETGVNHVDPSPHNMLLSSDERDLRMIDWEGCAFVAPRQVRQLVMHAAHFLNFAGLEAGDPMGGEWLDQLHAASGCSVERPVFQSAVAALQPRGRLRLAKRLALELDETTRALLEGCGP